MKRLLSFSLITLFFLTAFAQSSVYDFKVKDIDGKEVSLNQYKGKVILMVNVASYCGNTPQYTDIEALYKKYKDKGLVVMGFPANNFMGQEPGSNKDIKEFCSTKYSVTFPMFSKISVKGDDMAPLYAYLTQKDQNGTVDAKVTWNFQKFLVGRNGKVITSFAPRKSVKDEDVIQAIEKALADY